MQIYPSFRLSHWIKHYLIIETDHVAGKLLRMFSDGNTGIVINYKDPISLHGAVIGRNDYLPKSFIYGQQDTHQTILATGKVGMIVIVFHPFGASALMTVPANELRNQILGLDLFYQSFAEHLLDSLQASKSIHAKIQTIESFFTSRLSEQKNADTLSREAVKLIDTRNGDIRVSEITDFFGVNDRQLQRAFEQHVGISPKTYSGVIRIQHFLKLLRTKDSSASITSLAYDAGFYDQAHLIREVKNLSGITPGQYMAESSLLAANFIQIKS